MGCFSFLYRHCCCCCGCFKGCCGCFKGCRGCFKGCCSCCSKDKKKLSDEKRVQEFNAKLSEQEERLQQLETFFFDEPCKALQEEAERSERLLLEQQAQAGTLLSELQTKKQLAESLQEQIVFLQLENKELQERVAANADSPIMVKKLVDDYESRVMPRAQDRSVVASLEARAKQAEDELHKCRSEQQHLLSSLEARAKKAEDELHKCRSADEQLFSSLEARAQHAENELHKSRSEQAQLLASLEAQSKHAEDELHKSRSEQARLLASLEAQSTYAEDELRKSRSEQAFLQQEVFQAKKALLDTETVHFEKLHAASRRIAELESALKDYITLESGADYEAKTAELAWKLGGDTFEAWARSPGASPKNSVASPSSVY